ncbi:MAG: ATP-binding protein, partial [Actinomycetota bacterium]|nr:ATP-binding protein [Actinomycetota bacterium]
MTTGAQEELTDELRQHRAIIDEAPANIYVKDLYGRYLFVNAALVDGTGIAADRYLGHTDIEIFGPGYTDVWRRNDLRALDGRVDEIEVIGDPIETVYRSLKFALRDGVGEPYALCGISLDVTDRYRAERARGVAERRLAQLEGIDSVGRFASGLAHDLRNTLSAVQALVELAIEDAAELRADATRLEAQGRLETVLSEAHAAVGRSTDQISRLLAATQSAPSLPEPLDLAGLLRTVRPLLHTIVGADRLREHVPANLSTLLVDAGDLERVLVNLVTNAAQAAGPDGCVDITASAVVIEERIGTDPPPAGPDLDPGRYVRIEIADDGAGMTPEVLERARHPLFSTKRGGTGLGLWSVDALVLRNA